MRLLLTQCQLSGEPHDASLIILGIGNILLYLWGDFHFYWTHRMLHTHWFYKNVHKIHHESYNPDPFSGKYSIEYCYVQLSAFLTWIIVIGILMPSRVPIGILTREIGISDCYQLFDYELCSSCPRNGFVVQELFSPVQLALASWHANNSIYKLAI